MNESLRKNGMRALSLFLVVAIGSSLAAGQQSPEEEPAGGIRRLTLREAVDLALRNHRGILLAEAEEALATSEHEALRANFRPQVLLGSGLAATYGFPLSIEGSAPSIFQVATNQSLLDGNLRNLERQAGRMREAAGRTVRQRRDEVVEETILTYLDLDRARRAVEHARSQTDSLQAVAERVATRVEAGLEPPLELTRARLNAARAHSQQQALEQQIQLLEFRLRDMIGIAGGQQLETVAPELSVSLEETVEVLIRRALENYPGLQALDEQVRAKEYQVKAEEGSRWPRVNLVGQYGLFSKINNYDQYFRRFARNNATFGVSIVVPLYERERYQARLSRAQAELQAARLRRDELRATIEQQVRALWAQMQQRIGEREVARLELELARRSLDAVLAQYEEGRASLLAVEQARTEEDRAWVSLLDADYQTERARLGLLRLAGDVESVIR